VAAGTERDTLGLLCRCLRGGTGCEWCEGHSPVHTDGDFMGSNLPLQQALRVSCHLLSPVKIRSRPPTPRSAQPLGDVEGLLEREQPQEQPSCGCSSAGALRTGTFIPQQTKALAGVDLDHGRVLWTSPHLILRDVCT